MSSSLDRSLGDIIASNRKNKRDSGKGGAAGGISKRPQRAAAQKAQTAVTPRQTSKAAAAPSSDKIIVSNLPYDVTEAQIKEYFASNVGPVKRCNLTYGPDGRSRGIATIIFNKDGDAQKACDKYNGVLADKRPMKVEVVIDPSKPKALTLADRVGPANKPAPQPRKDNKPKPAGDRNNNKGGRGEKGARGGKGGKRGGKAAAPRKNKTAEELDAEMVDYFGTNDAPSTAAPAAAAAAPSATMEEEVL